MILGLSSLIPIFLFWVYLVWLQVSDLVGGIHETMKKTNYRRRQKNKKKLKEKREENNIVHFVLLVKDNLCNNNYNPSIKMFTNYNFIKNKFMLIKLLLISKAAEIDDSSIL